MFDKSKFVKEFPQVIEYLEKYDLDISCVYDTEDRTYKMAVVFNNDKTNVEGMIRILASSLKD